MSPESHAHQRQRLDDLADRAEERLLAARRIADGCRGDEALHRITMKAVFVLEDTHFTLRQIAESSGRA